MEAAKEWSKIDPKDATIISITTRLYKLEKKTSVLVTLQGGGCNIT